MNDNKWLRHTFVWCLLIFSSIAIWYYFIDPQAGRNAGPLDNGAAWRSAWAWVSGKWWHPALLLGLIVVTVVLFRWTGRSGRWWQNILIYLAIIGVSLLIYRNFLNPPPPAAELDLKNLVVKAQGRQIERIVTTEGSSRMTVLVRDDQREYFAIRPDGVTLVDLLDGANIPAADWPAIESRPASPWAGWANALPFILPTLVIVGLFVFMVYRAQNPSIQATGFGQIRPRRSTPSATPAGEQTTGIRPDLTFADVIGATQAKAALAEVVAFLQDPDRFGAFGAHVSRGVLLAGPPGTGKTLLARAMAGEAGVPFFSVSGSEFIEMFVGVGASRVRNLFEQAKSNAPCIVFVDEIDAIGQRRAEGLGAGFDSEHNQTLNQLLNLLSGFEQDAKPIVVIGATNRPHVLDPALVRPGRLGRPIWVPLPNADERLAIFRLYLRGKPSDIPDTVLTRLAQRCVGMSGADLEDIINKATILVARDSRERIATTDLELAARQVGWLIPELDRPDNLKAALLQHIVGQDNAIEALVRAAAYHYSDVRHLVESNASHPAKSNVFLYGPAGTGKSSLSKLLAQHIDSGEVVEGGNGGERRQGMPFAALDVNSLAHSSLTIGAALRRLLASANNDYRRAEYGIVAITGTEALRHPAFASIQSEIVRLIGGDKFEVGLDNSEIFGRTVTLDTKHVFFICEATLQDHVNLPDPIASNNGSHDAPEFPHALGIARVAELGSGNGRLDTAQHIELTRLGYSPSLLAHLPLLAYARPLPVEHLRNILTLGPEAAGNLFMRRFADLGIEVTLEEEALHEIARMAHMRGQGVRGLSPLLDSLLRSHITPENVGKPVTVTREMVVNASSRG